MATGDIPITGNGKPNLITIQDTDISNPSQRQVMFVKPGNGDLVMEVTPDPKEGIPQTINLGRTWSMRIRVTKGNRKRSKDQQ
jgi:hypothetical protein